ncbi:SHOCT domain-containing protein [Flavobacterium sp. TMP13]|uniref:SHOCT domain-containing protein n=1 Tax=Flavobacterium sp. TMP13 TaxID=3425950 RepID=UPI003D772043
MDNIVGVGLVIGLVTASSFYVWNSDNFTKIQKNTLLVFVLFPPLQWVSILVILLYNNLNKQKPVVVNTETNINSGLKILNDLKQKGIITEEEYASKINKVEIERSEQNFKNTLEYKQLESLLLSGILTKEEFENKIKILQEKFSYKDIRVKKVTVNKKESSAKIYLFSFVFFIILISLIILNSNNTASYSPPAKIVNTAPQYIEPKKQEPIKIKKFVYVIMEVEKPSVKSIDKLSFDNALGILRTTETIYYLIYDKELYTTDIIELEDYNEDEKYKILDSAKDKTNLQLAMYNNNFDVELSIKNDNYLLKEEFKKRPFRIINTQIYEFDSYSEASIQKEKDSKQIENEENKKS